jgi:hypothetical protein
MGAKGIEPPQRERSGFTDQCNSPTLPRSRTNCGLGKNKKPPKPGVSTVRKRGNSPLSGRVLGGSQSRKWAWPIAARFWRTSGIAREKILRGRRGPIAFEMSAEHGGVAPGDGEIIRGQLQLVKGVDKIFRTMRGACVFARGCVCPLSVISVPQARSLKIKPQKRRVLRWGIFRRFRLAVFFPDNTRRLPGSYGRFAPLAA